MTLFLDYLLFHTYVIQATRSEQDHKIASYIQFKRMYFAQQENGI